MNIVGNRRVGIASRSTTSQVTADWLSAVELAKHFKTSQRRIKDALYDLGYACRDSKKPTERSLSTGVARKFHAHGKDLYKWDRKTVMPELAARFSD